jgi:hypothetical protein
VSPYKIKSGQPRIRVVESPGELGSASHDTPRTSPRLHSRPGDRRLRAVRQRSAASAKRLPPLAPLIRRAPALLCFRLHAGTSEIMCRQCQGRHSAPRAPPQARYLAPSGVTLTGFAGGWTLLPPLGQPARPLDPKVGYRVECGGRRSASTRRFDVSNMLAAREMGTAKFEPEKSDRTAKFTPITFPLPSNTGPPDPP